MAQLYRLTTKVTVNPKLPKGTTFQLIVDSAAGVHPQNIKEAIKAQLGLDLPQSACQVLYFEKERIK